MPDINLAPTNYDLEAIQKRRKMAELLGQQAIQPIEMPQVPGARISPIQGIAKLLQAYISGTKLKKADAEEKQYQSDYLSDLGFLMRNAGKSTPATEAIPEKIENITTPIEANRNLQEIALRQSTMRDPNLAINPFERQMGADERAQVATLPGETVEQRVTPAVPAMKGSPLLSPDLLSGNNANNYLKTSAGKMALAQLLMQQQAQQQAAALKSQEVLKRNPEEDLYRVVDGKVETLSAGKPKAKLREIKTNNPITGMPETRFYPEDVLVAMGGIPDQYKGFAAELIMAKNLPANIKNDPQLINLVGSELNKKAGLVTEEDVANYMLKVQETRAKLGYEGIPFAEPKPLTAASNPLIKQTLPKGVPLDAVPTGKFTPEGKPVYKSPNGKTYVED
jgi:uncharacterized protein YcbK (DUF882 family)